MTMDYAYGFETIKRRDVLKNLELPRATRVALETNESKVSRDVPISMADWVQEQCLMWREHSAGRQSSNDLRIKVIREDTQREIGYLPRSDNQQLYADSMRERLYVAYFKKH